MTTPASSIDKAQIVQVGIPHYPTPPHIVSYSNSEKFLSPFKEVDNVLAQGFTGTDDDRGDDRKQTPKESDTDEKEDIPVEENTMEPGHGVGATPNEVSKVASSHGLKNPACKKEEKKKKEQDEKTGNEKAGVSIEFFSKSNQPDTFKQNLFERRSKAAVEEQLLQCASCKTGKECEWEGGQGVRLRIFARKLRRKYHLEDWQVRYNLYRLYQRGKMFVKGERHPLPFCVEVEIKRAYQGKVPHQYTFYQKGKEVHKDKPKTSEDINWLDGCSDAKLASAKHVYDYSPE